MSETKYKNISKNKISQPEMITQLNQKIDYLSMVRQSIAANDVLRIYELLDSARFNRDIRNRKFADSNAKLSVMTQTVQPEIAHFLAPKLISYVQTQFPFFDFFEINRGVYSVHFGDAGQSDSVGLLDVIKIEFIFDGLKLAQLEEAFTIAPVKTVNQREIVELQYAINALNEQKLSSQAAIAQNKMKSLQQQDEILNLEVKQIREFYPTFKAFEDKAANLYQNYLKQIASIELAY
jgi:hypothetical protein